MTIYQVAPKHNIPNRKRLLVGLILAGIFLLGLILRISYLREIVINPDFSFPQMDAGYHDYWARGLATGDWAVPEDFSDPEIRVSPYFRPPGYPFFLALIYFLSGSSYLAARIFQMGLGLLNCLLAYFLGRTLFNRGVGLIFAAFMSMYWVFIYFEGELLAPVLLVTLHLSLMHVLYLWCDKFTFRRAFAGGVLLGLSALVRSNILLFGPVVLVWCWWVGHRRNGGRRVGMMWLGFVLAAVMVIAPVTIRNYIVADDFVLITSNVGINLYAGNNEKSDGVCPLIPIAEEVTDIEGPGSWESFDYPQIVRGIESLENRKMKYSEVSSYFTKKAIDYIRKHPKRILKLMATKTAFFWGPAEVSNNKEIYYEKQNSITLRYMPGFPMVLSLAVVGLIQLFSGLKRRRGQNEAVLLLVTQRQFEISILIFLFVVTCFISYLPFFVAERFRVPIIPFLFLFGAYGLCRIGQLVVSRNLYRVVCWLVICIVLYIAASVPLSSYKPSLSRWHYLRGLDYLFAKQFDLAIKHYTETLRIKPDSADTHSNLAYALSCQGKLDEAVKHYTQALRIKPDSADRHSDLGCALARRGRLDEAIKHFIESLRIKPDNAEAHSNLGGLLVRQGKLDQAIVHFTEALRIKPDLANTHSDLGYALARQGKLDEAIKHYTEALRIKPGLADTHSNLAYALAQQGKLDEAVKHYTHALRIKPDSADRHSDLGYALARWGRLDEAIKHFIESLRIKPDNAEAHSNLGGLLVRQGKLDQAIVHFTEALRIKPDFADAHSNLGYVLARQGKLDEAVMHFTEALRIKPDFPDAHRNLRRALARQRKFDEAATHSKEQVQLDPNSAPAR